MSELPKPSIDLLGLQLEKRKSPEQLKVFIQQIIGQIAYEYQKSNPIDVQHVAHDPSTDLYLTPPDQPVAPESITLLQKEGRVIGIIPHTQKTSRYIGKSRVTQMLPAGKIVFDGGTWDPFNSEELPDSLLEVFSIMTISERARAETDYIRSVSATIDVPDTNSDYAHQMEQLHLNLKKAYLNKNRLKLTQAFISYLRQYLKELQNAQSELGL